MFSKTNAIFDDDGSRAWSSVVHKHRIDQRLLSPFNSLSLGVQIKKKTQPDLHVVFKSLSI